MRIRSERRKQEGSEQDHVGQPECTTLSVETDLPNSRPSALTISRVIVNGMRDFETADGDEVCGPREQMICGDRFKPGKMILQRRTHRISSTVKRETRKTIGLSTG